MKRLKKILFLIILFTSLFLIFPNDVRAINTNCNKEAAAFICEYYVPSSSEIVEWYNYLPTIANKAAYHEEMTFRYNLCTNGKGSLEGEFYYFGASGYKVSGVPFIDGPEYFYNKEDFTAKCPNAWIEIDNDLFTDDTVRIRKTKGKAKSGKYINCSTCSLYEVPGEMISYNDKPFYLDPTSFPSNSFDDCNAILGTEDYSLGWLIKKFLLYFKVLIPIVVLALSVVEFVKAIIVNDDDTLKKAQKRLIIRLVIAIVLFLVPTIVDLLLDVFGFTASNCNL